MSKITKIFSKVLVISTFLLLGICNAKAISTGDRLRFNYYSGNLNSNTGANLTAGGSYYQVFDYYATFTTGSNTGQSIKLYCIDPQRLNNKRGQIVSVSSVVDLSKYSINNAKYYGLATILQKGAINTDHRNLSNILQTDLAVRAYTYFILSDAGIPYNAGWNSKGSALMNLGRSVGNEYKGDLQSYLSVNFNKGGYNPNANLNGNASVINGAKSLLRQGYAAAIEYAKNKGLSNEVKVTLSQYDENKDTNAREVQEKVVNFRITQLSDKSSGYVKVGPNDIVCNNCDQFGVKVVKKEYWENNAWKELTSEVNLASLVDSKGNAKIKITLNKTMVDVDECGSSLTVNYRVPSPLNVQLVFVNLSGSGYQRYAGGLMTGSSNDANSTTKQYKVDIDCLLVPCDSELATPACQKEDNGYVKAPTNIKRCIINNVDEAGNTYELSRNNNGVDNAYCSTFCKEDYRTINLNKQISDLKCGGYFQLRARIEGSQDCYRGTVTGDKAINKTRFVDDIVDAQRTILNEYNKYLKATIAQGQPITTQNGVSVVSGTYNGFDVDKVNSDGTITTKSVSLKYEYRGNSEEEVKKAIQEDITSAQKNLDQKNYDNSTAYGQYLSIINNFNACTISWDNNFKFAQKVSWEYNEYIDGSLKETYYGLVAEKDRYLNPVESTYKTNTTIQACTGTIDNEYNLCNGSADNWQSTDAVFSNYNFTVCTTEGCATNIQRVSNARYVKQHVESEQDYETPSVFYQIAGSGPASGGITTNNTYTGPNIQLTPVEGLPLSLDSVGGGIFKLNIEDLGEFYDTGELGRLIDFGGKNEDHSVAKTQNKTDASKWDGSYECYYKNNCRVPECPTCDFECEGDYCEWKECPTCTVECVNCIYNLGELQLNFKPVSTSKFDSAGREYGYNWNISTNVGSLSLIKDKAEETIDQIEESNTTIYDDESADSKLEFSIKLTPDVTNYIRDYNKKIESEEKGGYNDPSLTCYDYEDENNAVYKNVFCYSNFIDGLIEKSGAEVYAKNRGDIANRTTESVIKSGYWEPWAGYKYDESVIGGPSWK